MLLRTLGLVGLLMPVVPVHAAGGGPGPYVLVGFGLSKLDLGDKQASDRAAVAHFEATVPGGTGATSGSASSAAFGVAMGYRVNPCLALEAAYWRFGEKSAGYTLRDATTVNGQDTRYDAAGPGVSLLGMLPLSSWRAYARVDAVALRTTVDEGYSFGAGNALVNSSSLSGLQLGYGLGVDAELVSGFALRLEARRISADFDTLAGVEARDLDSLTVALLKSF